ncbi:DUF4856 domain-containing protein [Alphaproteobacteria bacterium]|nr:DUF4856 domain-containing protein [Alphaproteobacteria bacterium]
MLYLIEQKPGLLEVSVASLFALSLAFAAQSVIAAGHKNGYGPFPVTVQGYKGSAENSVSYGGQIARQVLHNNLKKLASSGNPNDPTNVSEKRMQAHFSGKDADRKIMSPKSKDKFPIKQKMVDELSKKKNLSGKTYNGVMPAWPGNMTGVQVINHMIKKAGKTSGGVDKRNGYNYPQLISKFSMGAVFFNQACDNYLDEKLNANTKPNNKPYKKGAAYTGKEHVWDEAFGYWGAAAHTMSLSAKDSYNVAKGKSLKAADHNNDGVVDLKTEMTFAHAYYASSFDKGGKTNYLKTVTGAFIDGRKLITSANGNKLTESQIMQLKSYAGEICDNWEAVIAEAVFKYAGSVYGDIEKMEKAMASGSGMEKALSNYIKHWGELKGFAMALQAGKNNLGQTATKLNRMMGFGPLMPNLSQVVGVDSSGNFIKDQGPSMGYYKLHMIKIQKLMVETFGVKARAKDKISGMAALSESLGTKKSAEND